MKKLLTILVLSFLWSEDTYAGHMGELSQFFSREHTSLLGSKNVITYFKNKSGIKFGFTGDRRSYDDWIREVQEGAKYWCNKYDRDSYSRSLDRQSDWVLTWEFNCDPRAVKKNSPNNSISDSAIDSFIEFSENHSCAKKYPNSTEKWMECFFYPNLFSSSPVENFFRILWKEGNMSRNEYNAHVKHSIGVFKELCETTLKETEKIGCLEKIEKLNIKLINIST